MSDKPILLIEDNPDDQILTIRALKKNNIKNEIITVDDGEEALNYLFCRGEYSGNDPYILPELILLDLKLPKIDGLEVLKKIRSNERTRILPVVVLTTSNEQRDLLQSYDLGANSYIRKPVDFREFIGAVKQLGIYWLTINESPPPVGI